MADASSQDPGLLSGDTHPVRERPASKMVATARALLEDVNAREEAFVALEREHGATQRENSELKEKLRAAEEKLESAALNPGDLAAVLLQRFTCSGDLNLLISTLTDVVKAEADDTTPLDGSAKPLLVVHRLEPPDLAATIAAAAAAAEVSPLGLTNAIAEAAMLPETATEDAPKIEPDAEKENPGERASTKKRHREGDSDGLDTSSMRAWFRGSGVRTRQSLRASKKSH